MSESVARMQRRALRRVVGKSVADALPQFQRQTAEAMRALGDRSIGLERQLERMQTAAQAEERRLTGLSEQFNAFIARSFWARLRWLALGR